MRFLTFGTLCLVMLSVLFTRTGTVSAEGAKPYQRDFVITAYYSPQPDQCCYVLGSEEADKELNGNGTHGADGTPVFPGMLAAPSTYPFGTIIDLPGIGTFKVSDRGGAIIEGENTDRLDVWAGAGEEGLARALAFGVQRLRGTVYLPGEDQPAVSVDLAKLPAPPSRLQAYITDSLRLFGLTARFGQTTVSVRLLQSALNKLGYFGRSVTGFFGEETRAAFQQFLSDYTLDASAEQLTDVSAAYLEAALERSAAADPFSGSIDRHTSPAAIIRAKRTLRFLGFYKGRTNGSYDDALAAAILRFQESRGLANAESPWAGTIGPVTRAQVLKTWEKKLVASRAEQLLLLRKVELALTERNLRVQRFLSDGDHNTDVKALQKQLAGLGFFPSDRISGLYGPVTRDAVVAYQLARGIIKNADDQGAGIVGPTTLAMLRREQRTHAYNLVRANGWEAVF